MHLLTQTLAMFAVTLLTVGYTGANAQAQELPEQDSVLTPLLECYSTNQGLKQSGAIANLRDCIGTSSEACLNSPDGQSTQGMAGCIQQELDWWDALLNRQYQTLRTRLPGTKAEQLQRVQRQWLSYRDAKCRFNYDFWEGGSMRLPASAWCLMDTTAIRAIELEQWVDNVPG